MRRERIYKKNNKGVVSGGLNTDCVRLLVCSGAFGFHSWPLCAAPGDSRPVFVDRLSRPKSSKFVRFRYDATTLARCALRNGQVAAEVHFKTRHNINLDPHSLHNFRIFEATT